MCGLIGKYTNPLLIISILIYDIEYIDGYVKNGKMYSDDNVELPNDVNQIGVINGKLFVKCHIYISYETLASDYLYFDSIDDINEYIDSNPKIFNKLIKIS